VDIDGILNLDKPKGMTSFDVVSAIRRASGEHKVGHGGTLDPEATGVLPVFLGQATRLVEFLTEEKKTYRAEIELGISTDTYDATGKIVAVGDASILSKEKIESTAESFVGEIDQIPPMYSAVKHRGVPLYRYARAGVEIPRKARRVEIYRIEMMEFAPPLVTVEVECSKGVYLRAFANDLGGKLGCGAHLKNLVRLRIGPFNIKDAVTIAQVETAFRESSWDALIHPIDVVINHLPAVHVDTDIERSIKNGCAVELGKDVLNYGYLCRAYSQDGYLLAILCHDEEGKCWQPKKVFGKRLIKA